MTLAGRLPADPVPPLVGLAPRVGEGARVLVLGSMPGAESLHRQQYYAHPRNEFWRIVEDVFGIRRELSYEQRIGGLQQHGVALWDVLAACSRRGSLDTAIERASMRLNDIPGLVAANPSLRCIAFNGVFAEAVYRNRIGHGLSDAAGLVLRRLPSTSPANQSRPYPEKLAAWRAVLTWTP
jgi:TDG/mug DNA glycosylase family protein